MYTKLAHTGDNIERFIVGRQLLVVRIITKLNMMGAAIPKVAPKILTFINSIQVTSLYIRNLEEMRTITPHFYEF